MLSLLTNTSAMSAVSALAVTQRSLGKVQNEISSGLRIATAKDNAAYWSIATSMTTRVGEMQAVNDGLDLTSAVISTTTAALTTILGLTQGIAKDLVTAQTTGVDVANVQTDIASKQQQIISTAQSASFNGVNWLVSSGTVAYVGTYETHYAGTYADAFLNHGSTPIAVTEHDVDTVTTTQSQGSATSSTTTTTTDYVGTEDPRTLSTTSHAISGSVTTTGDPSGTAHDVDVLLTTGASTTFDLSSLQLFSSQYVVANRTTGVETFSDGITLPGVGGYGVADSKGVSVIGSGSLAQAFTLSHGQTSVLALDATGYSQADLAAAGSGVADALAGLQGAMTLLGGLQNQVDGSKSINTAISNALKSGVGSLVDADMNEDSTRLAALQTQQSLGVQALGIANSNSSIVMKLFGN